MRLLITLDFRSIAAVVLLHLYCCPIQAQLRYYHDADIYQQFKIMEISRGFPASKPALLHPGYKKEAPVFGAKTTHNMEYSMPLSKEPGYAETVDSMLNSRNKELLVETADRLVDVRWATEGKRIEGQLQKMQSSISLIRSWGGTDDEYNYWKRKYNMIVLNALPMVRDSYQPGYKRVEEYQNIYKELLELNNQLESCRSRWEAMKFIEERRNQPVTIYRSRFDSIAARCMGQWKLEAASASTAHPKAKKLRNVWKDN